MLQKETIQEYATSEVFQSEKASHILVIRNQNDIGLFLLISFF